MPRINVRKAAAHMGKESVYSVYDMVRKGYFPAGVVVRYGTSIVFDEARLLQWIADGHDPRQFRHYGPVAQEFFAAFGHDGLGTIGTDTTINSSDLEGILTISVQALEKRSQALQAENADLSKKIGAMQAENADLNKEIGAMKAENAELRARLEALERLLANLKGAVDQ